MKSIALLFVLTVVICTQVQAQDLSRYELDFRLPNMFANGRPATESDFLFCKLTLRNEEDEGAALISKICACGEGDPTRTIAEDGSLWSKCSVEVPGGHFYESSLVVYNRQGRPSAPYRTDAVLVPGELDKVTIGTVTSVNTIVADIITTCNAASNCSSDVDI